MLKKCFIFNIYNITGLLTVFIVNYKLENNIKQGDFMKNLFKDYASTENNPNWENIRLPELNSEDRIPYDFETSSFSSSKLNFSTNGVKSSMSFC